MKTLATGGLVTENGPAVFGARLISHMHILHIYILHYTYIYMYIFTYIYHYLFVYSFIYS